MGTRIDMDDTVMASIVKMSDGNAGAVTVLAQAINEVAGIDPDSAFGGLGVVLALDSYGIYGSHIWMLYKDVCGQDLRVMCAMLRAVQLGFLRESELTYAIENRGHGVNVPAMISAVEMRLPNFQRAK